jgi:predicted PurR-regulated permease PerM
MTSFEPRNVWRVAWIVVAALLVTKFGLWVLADGGSFVFTIIMSWLASIAMEPAVSRLAHHMRRGMATMVVMGAVVLFAVVFLALFGKLLADQIGQLIRSLPTLVQTGVNWANKHFGTHLEASTLPDQMALTPSKISSLTAELAGSLLGIVVSVLSAFFSTFTFGLFTFYLSADAPRLRRWIARLFPTRRQGVVVTVWELAVAKTGGYVAARIVLAGICGGSTALFLFIIGMPYWLALGLWTGVVAQFVPTIGTYIAIALPMLIGFLSSDPADGVLALAFAPAYQQIENLTIEPKISARAVNVHPAVSFGSVLLGAALFGVAGALVAVPVAAMLLALFEIYSKKYELVPELEPAAG